VRKTNAFEVEQREGGTMRIRLKPAEEKKGKVKAAGSR
jgi:hypothetical protein